MSSSTIKDIMKEHENLSKIYAILVQELELQKNKLKGIEDCLKPIDEKRRLRLAREKELREENPILVDEIASMHPANDRLENLLDENLEVSLFCAACTVIGLGAIIAFSVLVGFAQSPILLILISMSLVSISMITIATCIGTLYTLVYACKYYIEKEANVELIQEKQNRIAENQEALYKLEMEGLMSSPKENCTESAVQFLTKLYQKDIALLEDQVTALEGEMEFTEARLEYLHSQEGSEERPLREYFAAHSFFGGAERVAEQAPVVASDLSPVG